MISEIQHGSEKPGNILLTLYHILYSKVSNKRTVFINRTGGDIILQKV